MSGADHTRALPVGRVIRFVIGLTFAVIMIPTYLRVGVPFLFKTLPALTSRPKRTIRASDRCSRRQVLPLSSSVPPAPVMFFNETAGEIGRFLELPFRSRSHDAAIRVYDEAGNVIETHENIPERIEHFWIV